MRHSASSLRYSLEKSTSIVSQALAKLIIIYNLDLRCTIQPHPQTSPMFPTTYASSPYTTSPPSLHSLQSPLHDNSPHRHHPVTDPATDPTIGASLYQQHDYGAFPLYSDSFRARSTDRRKEWGACRILMAVVCGCMAIAFYCFIVHGIWTGHVLPVQITDVNNIELTRK
jgi:hypothetical protein